jgi:hypothetical protein
VVGVERGEELFTSFDADFRFRDADQVYLCGTQTDIDRYQDIFAS